MNILVVYGTVEGQTKKIAGFVEKTARDAGHDVTMFDTAQRLAPVELDGISHVVLAASVHERRHQKEFEVFVTAHRAALAECKTLMLSVSLSAAFEDGLEEAAEYLTEMQMRTDFKADKSVLVAGAVRTGSYDYFESQVIKHVVMQDRDYDPNSGEHEFTDWDALTKELNSFLKTA